MKSCPTCRRLYNDDAGFCPIDGVALLSAIDVPPAPSDDDDRLGQILSQRYQVRRVVADGGMGRVYEALDIVHNRRVALKVLHEAVATDRVALERFKREFEISTLLPHEHIVEVFDFLKLPGGSCAIAMDFLEGEELRALLKRENTLRPERVVRMLSQIAIGLDEPHRKQLVHRDLKPDNIFMCGTREGDTVKLLDFGSVKDKSEGAKKLTVMGTTIGSPFYMSPEQAQGLDSLDARADVWALAAIAYECLTGTVPFTGSNGPSILLSILTREPERASAVAARQTGVSAIPASVDEVMVRAFMKNPALRIMTVGDLADRMGHAYGLTGSHRDWAYMPIQVLFETVEAALLSMPVVVQARGQAERDPFAQLAAPPPSPVDRPAPPVAQPVHTADLVAVVPRGLPIGAVAAAAGVVGVVVAVVLYVLLT